VQRRYPRDLAQPLSGSRAYSYSDCDANSYSDAHANADTGRNSNAGPGWRDTAVHFLGDADEAGKKEPARRPALRERGQIPDRVSFLP